MIRPLSAQMELTFRSDTARVLLWRFLLQAPNTSQTSIYSCWRILFSANAIPFFSLAFSSFNLVTSLESLWSLLEA